jgi:N-acetylneuraminate synthase
MIPILKKKFNVEIGLSDHTLDNLAATLSVAKGAVAIEKHFILDKSFTGPDSSFSMDPNQLEELVKDTHMAWKSLGSPHFERAKVENSSLVFRRSLYFVNDLKMGEIITENDIKRIRPGFGLKPKFYEEIIGKKIAYDVERGDPVTWKSIK